MPVRTESSYACTFVNHESCQKSCVHDASRVRTNLLHDASLSLGEGDVSTRLVRDELDLNLSALASRLVIVIIVVVGGRCASSLDAARFSAAIAHGVLIEAGG